VKTPLTYYGGKQRLASEIVRWMPPHCSYLEPFCGGAAVLFAKPVAERETLNDLDGSIVRFWRALRDRPDELAAAAAGTPYSREEWALSRDQDAPDDVEAARRLLVNIDQSFSRSRESWSPPSTLRDRRGRWQPGSWDNLPPKLLAAAHRLKHVCLEHGDALALIPRWDFDHALIYVDPPYLGEHRRTMEKGYPGHDATPEMWEQLIDLLLGLERAAVILSGYPNEHTARLGWRGWREVPLIGRRNVQARAGGALPFVPETIWVSPHAAEMTLFAAEDAHARAEAELDYESDLAVGE
jgi:DNA adenine methylase